MKEINKWRILPFFQRKQSYCAKIRLQIIDKNDQQQKKGNREKP